MADIEICIEQLKYLLVNSRQIEQIKVEKIQRTEQRLLGDTGEQRIKVTSAEIEEQTQAKYKHLMDRFLKVE